MTIQSIVSGGMSHGPSTRINAATTIRPVHAISTGPPTSGRPVCPRAVRVMMATIAHPITPTVKV